MKKVIVYVLLITMLNCNLGLSALAANRPSVDVKSGFTIPIIVTQENTSKSVIAGQKINAQIEDDIKINGVKVFQKGDSVFLNVSEVKKAGFIGIPGMLYIVNGEVTDANGDSHLVEYNQKFMGDEKTWPKVCVGCGVFIILAPLVLFGFVFKCLKVLISSCSCSDQEQS